jgi:hypothetical protein
MIAPDPKPCIVCAVRKSVFSVLMADKAGDHPVPDIADFVHRTIDALTALHRLNIATNKAAEEARAVKAADALATLFADLNDIANVHDDEPCTCGVG